MFNPFDEPSVISGNIFGKVRKFELTWDILPLMKIILAQNQAYVVCYLSSAIFLPKIEEKYLLLRR